MMAKRSDRGTVKGLHQIPKETENLKGQEPDKMSHPVSALNQWYPVTKRCCITKFATKEDDE
jgi:hypothetical protein